MNPLRVDVTQPVKIERRLVPENRVGASPQDGFHVLIQGGGRNNREAVQAVADPVQLTPVVHQAELGRIDAVLARVVSGDVTVLAVGHLQQR